MNNKLLIDSLINIDDSGMPQPPKTRQLIDKDVRELYRRDTSKDKQKYELTPYAITSNQGRFYAIMYNEAHKSFNTYRIDKMDTLSIINKDNVKVAFNLDNYLRNSFQMFSGEASTVSLKCPLNFASILFDEFGKDIIISKVTNDHFIASIRTSITPTFTSWILQFYDKIEVVKPKELIDDLKRIANHINKTY